MIIIITTSFPTSLMQENIDSELSHLVHTCSGTEEMETLTHINEVRELPLLIYQYI